VAPPVTWPEWNPESPYVWLRKEMLPRLQVPIISEQGEVLDSAALVLCLDPAARSELNQQLKRLLAEHRALELTGAEVTDSRPSAAIVRRTCRCELELVVRQDKAANFLDNHSRRSGCALVQ
jgi:Mlc titration factor MtfA (ptsG expression regulator)